LAEGRGSSCSGGQMENGCAMCRKVMIFFLVSLVHCANMSSLLSMVPLLSFFLKNNNKKNPCVDSFVPLRFLWIRLLNTNCSVLWISFFHRIFAEKWRNAIWLDDSSLDVYILFSPILLYSPLSFHYCYSVTGWRFVQRFAAEGRKRLSGWVLVKNKMSSGFSKAAIVV
jgi:hypothetical protein